MKHIVDLGNGTFQIAGLEHGGNITYRLVLAQDDEPRPFCTSEPAHCSALCGRQTTANSPHLHLVFGDPKYHYEGYCSERCAMEGIITNLYDRLELLGLFHDEDECAGKEATIE